MFSLWGIFFLRFIHSFVVILWICNIFVIHILCVRCHKWIVCVRWESTNTISYRNNSIYVMEICWQITRSDHRSYQNNASIMIDWCEEEKTNKTKTTKEKKAKKIRWIEPLLVRSFFFLFFDVQRRILSNWHNFSFQRFSNPHIFDSCQVLWFSLFSWHFLPQTNRD